MSKTGELASVVEDLSVIGKTLAAVGEDLIRTAVRVKACFPEDCLAAVPPEGPPVPEGGTKKKVLIEEIRSRLMALAEAGFRSEAKSLVRKYSGGGSLTDVDPALYPALMEEVEKIHG